MYAGVVFNISFDHSFYYEIPEHLREKFSVGKRAIVPIRSTQKIGLIINQTDTLSKEYPIRPIIDIIDEHPILSENDLKLYSWIARYYRYPLAKVIWQSIPKKTSRIPKAPEATELSEDTNLNQKSPPILTPYQNRACDEIAKGLESHAFSSFLLHGVTGSGKTEVYLRSIDYIMREPKTSAIVLVPEIALTPQLIEVFTSRFGKTVGVFHSKMTDVERYTMWMHIIQGKIRVIIGVRSLVLLPIPNIRLIVVDEEHETTYKQDSLLLYNARDTALMKGKIFGCTVILGSATPSIESYYNAKTLKYKLLELPKRITNVPQDKAIIIDMRAEDKAFGESPLFSEKLEEEIKKNLDLKQKTILFLNRRGFSSLILCNKCGNIVTCKFCSVSLTYHAGVDTLLCHYCGYSEKFSDKCLSCGKHAVTRIGIGTERIEHELRQKFPDAKLFRMDRDTTKKRRSAENFHELFKNGSIDILIGTQMIAKGLDFPEVTLVGIIYADLSLNIPDFRACERTFQLITQVAGRAGRGEHSGRVIIQTFNPEHYSILRAKNYDYISFYRDEIAYRKDLSYPPYSRIANIRISGISERTIKTYAEATYSQLANLRSSNALFTKTVSLLGPSPCPIYKINTKFRWNILIKAHNANVLNSYIDTYISKAAPHPRDISFKIDIDPLNFL